MNPNKQQAGFTLTEAIAIVALIALFALMLWPAKTSSKIPCLNNQRRIGTAYSAWASDHGGQFPAAVSASEGGWRELLTNRNAGPYCWTNYAILNGYGRISRDLICPSDIRKPATNFSFIANSNLSYFVGVSASPSNPQSILGGDRNLAPGSTPQYNYGFSPEDNSGNDVIVQTNSAYRWSLKMHSAKGYVLFADGSAHPISNAHFGFNHPPNRGIPNSRTTNNAAPLPPPQPEFRLIFP